MSPLVVHVVFTMWGRDSLVPQASRSSFFRSGAEKVGAEKPGYEVRDETHVH